MTPPTLAAGTRLGAYEITAPLGAGGMGEVYRARHPKLGREVVLKVLRPDLAADRERLARFEQEARAASALNHPGIVQIYDIGEQDGVHFIAMELIEGSTVRQLMRAGRLGTDEVMQVAVAMAEALAKAHATGIVHRDLKPENAMVTPRRLRRRSSTSGLAKLVVEESAFEEVTELEHCCDDLATRPGTLLGHRRVHVTRAGLSPAGRLP